ncbi:MAG: DUF5915 domain-containing protein [Thaumarchaeota archaeon]|nr:DUF5915 domain-containing protein [Nitrososphaerota archaeon]
MKAKVKRRWPLRKAFYLVSEDAEDLILANKDLLLEQTNLQSLELAHDPSEIPLVISARINYELVAPKAKQKVKELADMVASSDALAIYKEMMSKGKATMPQMPDLELSPPDVQFTFSAKEPKYTVSENYGMVVALDASRDEALISAGLLRDIARNLQSLRKEKGFNPTDVLDHARVAGIGDQNLQMLETKKEELIFLVRVKRVELFSGIIEESKSWSDVEIDGSQVKMEIG